MDFEYTFSKLIIGAISAFFGACVGSIFSQRKERRDIYRRLLEGYVDKFGSHCYQSVAIAHTLHERIKTGKSRASWLSKHKSNRVELENIRLVLRYPLWGCNEGIRCLIRLPTWICLCHKDQKTCSELLKLGTNLRRAIDKAVISALNSGAIPSCYRILIINHYVKKIKLIYKDYMAKKTHSNQ